MSPEQDFALQAGLLEIEAQGGKARSSSNHVLTAAMLRNSNIRLAVELTDSAGLRPLRLAKVDDDQSVQQRATYTGSRCCAMLCGSPLPRSFATTAILFSSTHSHIRQPVVAGCAYVFPLLLVVMFRLNVRELVEQRMNLLR